MPSDAGPRAQDGPEPKWIYLSDDSVNRIEVLDPETFRPVANIEMNPRLIGGMAFSPGGERLYATLWRSTTATPPLPGQVAIVDTATNRIVDRITLTPDSLPSDPAASPDGKFLFFADPAQIGQDSNLLIVDLANKTVAEKIPASVASAFSNRFYSLALSPDGGLICVTDEFGVALLDTRTRTFVGRVNISLPNRQMPPVFHPDGSKVYVIERRFVSGALAVWLVAIDTASLTEVGRVTLPGLFDPRNLVITPDGLNLAMDGFLRPTGQPAKAVFILVDAATNAVLATREPAEPTVGALGVILR
jgi:DNA-binding beta-propeller fold protein YncE